VNYLEFLRGVHRALAPPTYLEIGVRHGDSLKLAKGRAVGVDPAYKLKVKLREGVKLHRETSDEYFARGKPPLAGHRIALSFIDGMHLSEFVVRDFMNVERHALWTSVVVFDDILPRTVEEAARDRRTRAWTGDVYKALRVLAEHRPDLICLRVDTEPTGLGVILGLDPESTVLRDRYDDIVAQIVSPDPQDVPDEILRRAGVVDPAALLGSSVWQLLRDSRRAGVAREPGVRRLRRVLKRELGVSDAPALAHS
jgi:hypothetical protein